MLSSAMRAAIDANAAFLTQVTAGKLFGEQVDDSADASAAGGAVGAGGATRTR